MTIEAIWQEYKNQLSRFLHSRVANPADVEDLLQDILIKSHNNLHKLNDNKSVKAWLFNIANNTIIDFYRSKARRHELNAEDLWYEEAEADIKQELAQCVRPFIQALPASDAQLLTAIEIDKIPQKDYAEQHGLRYSTLKSRVQKSRKLLRALYDNCCHMSLDKDGNIVDYQHKSHTCRQCP